MKKIGFFLWLLCGSALWAAEIHWEIRFQGVQSFSQTDLRDQLGIPQEFGMLENQRRDFLMRIARNALENYYISEGFFGVDVALVPSMDPDSVWIYSFTVTEGPKYHFRHVMLEMEDDGIQLLDAEKLRTSHETQFRFTDIVEDLATMRTLYRRNGYLHLRIDHEERVDTSAEAVDVVYRITTGPQIRMGDLGVVIQRNTQHGQVLPGLTDTAWFARLWEVSSGQTVDGAYLSDFRRKILGTQVFTQMQIQDYRRSDTSGLSNIFIHAQERVPGETKLGASFEQTYGFGFSADTRHRNLFGTFHEGYLLTSIAQNRQEATIGYANPLLFGTKIQMIPTAIRLDGHILFSHEDLPPPEAYPDSITERSDIAGQLDLSFGLSDHVRSRTSAELRYIWKPMSQKFRAKMETSLPIDFTNDSFEPTKGVRIVPTVGVGQALVSESGEAAYLGNPYPYLEIKNMIYLHIYGPLLFAMAYDYGRFIAEASEEDAATFYQGGSRSVRGYGYHNIYPSREVATSDSTTETDLGLTPRYHRFSGELRLNFPMHALKAIQLVTFLDWARVEDKNSIYERSQHMAVGTGLRYRWKVLTLRLDYTWKKTFSDMGLEPFHWSRFTFDLSQAI
ncbi:MAG TPA: BamA/TamA family outer membrane protein [Fibrobacteraceae bacterium]|nr:BamA/TamA family outer membrane protein [Fibrobacteraceae bacterium]